VDSPALQAQLQVVMEVSPECTEARLMTVEALFASGDYGCVSLLPHASDTCAASRKESCLDMHTRDEGHNAKP
jgi:hypothetical protein